jgi:hypothetical protein
MAKDNDSKSLAIGNLGSVLSGLGEVALDSFINDGIAKDIPILGTLTGLYKSGINVNEHIFHKKVERLINNVSNLSKDEINDFNLHFESDREYQIRVAEHLTLIIDRLDDLEKTKLLAKAFSGFIRDKIDFVQFRRIARAIERCMIEDLKEVHNFERANDAFSEITYELAASGLIELVQLPQVSAPDVKSMYKITEFGELFVQTVL